MNRIVKYLATASLGLALAAPFALAQPAPPAGPPKAEQQQHRMKGHMQPAQRAEAELAYWKTALKITPAQEAQWNTVADLVRKQAATMTEHMKSRSGQKRPAEGGSAIERLERQQSHMAQGAQHMGEGARAMAEFVNAAKPLYASFSDDQKKVADELLASRRHGMGGHHGRGMMGGGPMMRH
jgi:protein CpxP